MVRIDIKKLREPIGYDGEVGYYHKVLEKMTENKKLIQEVGEEGYGSHLDDLTLRQKGFVFDYIMAGCKNPTEAVRLNFDCGTYANRLAYKLVNDPKIKQAIEDQLKYIGANIDENYITDRLLKLERMAENRSDLSAFAKAMDLLMKLKGLGSQRVINENYEKKTFDLDAENDYTEQLIEAIQVLLEAGKVDLDLIGEGIKLLKEESPQVKAEVNVIENGEEKGKEIIEYSEDGKGEEGEVS